MVLLIPYQHSQDFKIKNKIGLHPWPTLNNTSDSIYLTTSENDVMHQIGYDERGFDSFYGDGSSIELENPWNPCGEVWKTTISSTGGTPGTINSIFTTQNDTSHLEIVDYDHKMNGTLMVYLNKPIDTISINKSTFFINGDQVFPDLNQSMGALITFPFVGISGIFTLTIEDLVDCWSNPLSENTITWTADFDPPEIDSINYSHFDELTIYFNESIEQPESENIFLDGIGNPSNITLQASNAFKLRFPTTLYPQEHFKISIINVSDIRGNILDSTYLEVDLVPPKMARSFEVIVTEFKPITNNEDEYEYIELYNNSESPWLLRGYRVADNRNETTLDDYLLLPHTYVVLLPSTKKSATGIKNVLFVKNWNSLNNDGDIISIRNPAGDIIHQIEYNKTWFESLSIHDSHEMIDTAFPCRGLENWKGVSKGSPGFQNSVKDSKPDLVGPSILSSWIEGEDSVMIVFDERLDTLSILSATYSFIPNISDFKISVIANNQILISLDNPLSKSEPYKLIAEYIKDCSGNTMTKQNIELINPDYPQKDDVVINEILFNPEVGGVDFIEIYNTSNKYFKIKDFRIGGLNDTLSIKSEVLLHPHQFMVFTKSKELLMNFHPSAPYEKIVRSDLPQLPDDAGIVILLADSVIDQFSYSEGLHHDLQINHEGVSLERLSPFEASDNPDNWKSAASIVGYATPGKLNSNYLVPENHEDIISIEPRVFNPDNSTQPFTTIYYQFKHPGNVTTVSVFDSNGVKVKTLLNNKTLGTTGFFTWEGTNDSSKRVRTGYYLLLFEIIHPNGKIEQLKEKIVVATEF